MSSAMLPAALAGGLLVSAPFAGTTTAPLVAETTTLGSGATTTTTPTSHHSAVSMLDILGLGTAELLLVGVGAGVALVARNERRAATARHRGAL